jgi:hypothetical protein
MPLSIFSRDRALANYYLVALHRLFRGKTSSAAALASNVTIDGSGTWVANSLLEIFGTSNW